MFARIARSWSIFKNSLLVLRSNKKLIVFPMLTSGFVIAIVLLVFSGIFAVASSPQFDNKLSKMSESSNGQKSFFKLLWAAANPQANEESSKADELSPNVQYAWLIILLFMAYFVSIFMATFFNVAFYSEIINGLNSEPVFLMRGFKFAFSKCGSIAMWALLGATVGTALKLLEERFGWLGQWVIRLIGLAWNVVTVFAVPVIICEEDSFNPIKNLKKSASVIRTTWGESLIGFLGISALNGLLIIPTLLLTVVLAAASGLYVSVILSAIVAILGTVAIVCISMLLGVAQKIYIASLYLYATTGFLNEAYDEEQMQNPWKVKR
jgi:hypothetical protein